VTFSAVSLGEVERGHKDYPPGNVVGQTAGAELNAAPAEKPQRTRKIRRARHVGLELSDLLIESCFGRPVIEGNFSLSCSVAFGEEETPVRGAKRSFKFPLTEIPVNCPHCKAALILATAMDTIKFGQRTCPMWKAVRDGKQRATDAG
jgi:hypothetical protein